MQTTEPSALSIHRLLRRWFPGLAFALCMSLQLGVGSAWMLIDQGLSVLVGLACAVAGFAWYYLTRRPDDARPIGYATTTAAASFALGLAVAGTLNIWLDRSRAVERVVTVGNVATTRKLQATVSFTLDGVQAVFPLELDPTCTTGGSATLRIRAGALGMRWVESARCTRP